MVNENNITVVGTSVKFALSLTLPGNLTMDDVDFSASFFVVPGKSITIGKEEMLRVSKNTYTCVVDTTAIGAGNVKCQVEVLIPDAPSPGGVRKEIICLNTGEEIRYGMYRR